jgi:predicted Ser/Thr protein kinase
MVAGWGSWIASVTVLLDFRKKGFQAPDEVSGLHRMIVCNLRRHIPQAAGIMDSSTPSSDPFHGLNPADLMAAAAMPTDGGADTLPLTPRDLPSLAEIAAAFPDLEILDLIGHGGMSAVFRARQPRLDRMVALKVLPKSLAATPGFAERFTREGRVLARLSHPNIVTVHDFGESGGFCFLIMEYVDGVNLRQAMRAGRFTPEQALNIIPVMCEALQYAHSQGVLHRDIKPENILLDTKGRVKIADFGIAKILNEDGDGGMMLTQSGAKLGTAPYMAPEQIEKPGSVDHRADIYSLGVVFYEMLTGELPLGRFAAPSEKSSVSGGMDEVVFRALAKDRAMRQQSAGEFKTQIEGIASMPSPMPRSPAGLFSSFEYKSKRTLLGRPLLHVAHGIDPATGRKRTAHGFFAFGDRAVGVFAFGGYARGLFACGGLAVGLVALGGMSIGLISLGGLALALLLAYGGLSVGFLATGGIALGWVAVGGFAAGVHAYGGQVYAMVSGMGGRVHAPLVMKTPLEMPPLLQLLVWITDQSSLMAAWLWFPALMPSMLVPWWARRQLEFEAQGGEQRVTTWYERPSRVLWLLPSSFLLFLAVIWMTHHWSHAGAAGMTAQMIVASGVECVGILFAGVSLPLWLRLVPMNSFYGVRLPSTFVSNERWYDVNAVFGRHLFGWSLTVVAASIAGFYQLPRHQDAYAWAALTLVLVGVAASVASTLVWMRRHPVGRPVIKPHRLVRNLELVIPVVVLMMFVRSFVARPYHIPSGNEPGVAKNSRWIASHLDTGFAQGDLIAYAHENGQTWIARVVAVEVKGLLLKRGSSPAEFLMPWDKIIGKMLFSYLSPGTRAIEDKGKPSTAIPQQNVPVVEGTKKGDQIRGPELRFVQLKLGGDKDWSDQIYDLSGHAVTDANSLNNVAKSLPSTSYLTGKDKDESCMMQFWFDHPDFDFKSELEIELLDDEGKPVWAGHGASGFRTYDSNQPPLRNCTLIVGKKNQLPKHVDVALNYSLGPWEMGDVVTPEFTGEIMLKGAPAILTGIGTNKEGRAFLTWHNEHARHSQIDCFAVLKSGLRTGSYFVATYGMWVDERIESARFQIPLADVESFQIRSRQIKRKVFKKVVLPPLP